MYRGFLKLHEAAQLIAEHLATEMSLDPVPALAEARRQLIQALYDEAVYSEGFWWDTGEAANRPEEVPNPVAPERSEIAKAAWSTEGVDETKRQENESLNCSALDRGIVVWDKNAIELEDEFGEPCVSYGIRVRYADIFREFLTPVSKPGVTIAIPGSNTAGKGSGFVGRPTSKHIVEAELRRRAQEGRLCETLAEETRELSDWLRKMHPDERPATAKAIENGLRHLFWELKATRKPRRSA
jgi:hypothetical protein